MTRTTRTYRKPGQCIKCNNIQRPAVKWMPQFTQDLHTTRAVIRARMVARCVDCGYQWTVLAKDEMEGK